MASNDDKKPGGDEEEGSSFDMYHLFSRWDFILLVLFVLMTLILTVMILTRGHAV